MPSRIAKFPAPMTTVALTNYATGFDIERREPRGGAVAKVVRGAALRLRPGRIGRIGCIRLRAWIWDFSSAHKTRARSGGIKIKPDNVAHLLHQLRVGREFEAFAAMRAQAKGTPDAADRRPAETCPLRPSDACSQWVAPLGVVSSVRVTNCSTCSSLILRGAPDRGSSQQTFQAADDESSPPLADHPGPGSQLVRHRLVVEPHGATQYDPRPQAQLLRHRASPRVTLQRCPLFTAQHQHRLRPPCSHAYLDEQTVSFIRPFF